MKTYTPKELEDAQKALTSLVHKCEKAKTSLHPGTPQWTTLTRRMEAFSLALQIVTEKRDELQKGKE